MSRRIESKTSRTAEFTCLARAQSYMENRAQYKSNDYIALAIMNRFVKLLIQTVLGRKIIMGLQPVGMYEYVIARTKLIDKEFMQALSDGFEQILIFGAGFDSRGIRFKDSARGARIFELDTPITQTSKINRYKEMRIAIPENLVFIPIDFEKDSLPQRLMESGFNKSKKSLFLLEGLTMYLQPEAVDGTFKIIREFAGTGSKIVFDHIYASVLRRENLYDGEKELYGSVNKNKEQFCFGIEKGSVDEFLSHYGMEALSVHDSNALEDMFFKDINGNLVSKVNGTHCIVAAGLKSS